MMKYLKHCLLAISVSVLVFSCNSDEGDQTSRNDDPGNADSLGAGQTNNNNTGNADAAFLSEAAYSDLKEIEAGRLAQSRASASEVKELANMMVTDHQAMSDKIKALAGRKNVALPDSLSTEDRDMLRNEKKTGREFDKAYTSIMVDEHERAIRKFESASNSSADPEVKALVNEALPRLRHHLEMAKAARDKVKG